MNRKELEEILEKNSDPGFREFNLKITPYSGKMYGVRMPVIRSIAKDIAKGDWRAFMEEESGSFEQSMIRALLVATAEMDGQERLERLSGFIPEVDNWAVCDLLCGSFRIDSEDTYSELWHMCTGLLYTGKEFPMRVGAVMMLNHFIDGRHADDVIGLMCTVPGSGYYYDMAAAWALSYCYIAYPEKTEDRMFRECASMTILRMAVRKIRESYRVGSADKERVKGKLKDIAARSRRSRP